MARPLRRRAFTPRWEPLEGRSLLSTASGELLLVGLVANAPTRPLQLALRGADARIVASYPGGTNVVELAPGTDPEGAMARIRRTPGVRYVEADGVLQADAALPNDPLVGTLWGLNSPTDIDIDAPEGWAIRTGGPGTVVAIVDSGIDLNHPDLAGRIWVNPGEIPGNGRDDDRNGFADDVHGWNFLHGSNDVRDRDGHGTHVAGTIAAAGNNGIGVVGVAPGVRLMPLKFFGPSSEGQISHAVAAIHYAVNNGAKVINASWSGPEYSAALEDAIVHANARGVVVVTAAGNEGRNLDASPTYPASLKQPNLLSVAAIDRNGQLVSTSNFGVGSVDVAAPGFDIRSTVPGGGYASYSGTSMATPHVAAVAALVAEQDPGLSPAEIVERIRGTAKRLPSLSGRVAAGGIVDADAALSAGAPAAVRQDPAPTLVVAAADLRAIVLGSDEFYQTHGATAGSFLEGIYQAVLGRSTDPEGRAFWTGLLDSGWSRQQVARAILGSEEAHRTAVARWFVADLQRPESSLQALKDEPLIHQCARALAGGLSEDVIRSAILSSDEFYGVHGGTPEQFVDALYRALLGRPVEPLGLALWTGALRMGRSRLEVAGMILVAPEARQTSIARWFADDLNRQTPLEQLKAEPMILTWAMHARF